MIKFTHKYLYDEDDERMSGECQEALIDESGKMLLFGDYYHDKISVLIDGFLQGLKYAGIEYEVVAVSERGYIY